MTNTFKAGMKLLRGAYTQYTPSGKDLFVRQRAYNKVPRRGDIVYFYSSSIGRVCHVGAVISVTKSEDRYAITTVEGNTTTGQEFNRNGGGVAYKNYSFTLDEVGGSNRINGFGTPLFCTDTCSVEDFIKTLQKEVGYLEKASNANLHGKTENVGKMNFTKYGQFFADNKLGGNGLYWCQQFISWCAYTACCKQDNVKKTGWEKCQSGDWMYLHEGNYVKNQWWCILGRWYVFAEDGKMIKGWFKSEKDWYYLNSDGAMLSGQWVDKDSKSYYLTSTGAMAKSCYIKSGNKNVWYWVDENGEYRKEYDTTTPDLSEYELAV